MKRADSELTELVAVGHAMGMIRSLVQHDPDLTSDERDQLLKRFDKARRSWTKAEQAFATTYKLLIDPEDQK